jgi:tungstate transport system substrate-binding protein
VKALPGVFTRFAVFGALLLSACGSQRERVVLATTTSIEDTGLLDTLTTAFEAAHPDYVLAPVAVGTGMVLEMGRRKDADVLIAHDSAGEMQFVEAGHGHSRRYVMENYFVLAGPPEDPAGVRNREVIDALRMLATQRAAFVSRADDSGTHRRELMLWRQVGVQPAGEWYIESGVGMGDALLMAGQKRAYILSDRSTFGKFRDRVNLEIMVNGGPQLVNKYSVILVTDAKNEAGGKAFADWLVSTEARRIINGFVDETGARLFDIKSYQ